MRDSLAGSHVAVVDVGEQPSLPLVNIDLLSRKESWGLLVQERKLGAREGLEEGMHAT